jgi:hypothetical protein
MNSISTLQHEDGSWYDDVELVKEEIPGFYKNLYTSEGAPKNAGRILNLVNEKVVHEDKANLQADSTEEEVKMALIHMQPPKAPGVDGFTTGFYQRHWILVDPELYAAVLAGCRSGIPVRSHFLRILVFIVQNFVSNFTLEKAKYNTSGI